MRKTDCYFLPFWTTIIGLLTLNLMAFSIMVMTSSDDLRVQYIPDDGYYYLTLARNFSTLSFWTFDSGISVTSGFHPLFAYLLAFVVSFLKPNAYTFVTYSMTMSLLFTLASVMVIWYWGFKFRNSLFLMMFALIISSRNFVYNTISITEWSLTVLLASLYCVWFFTKSNNSILKRSDFLVLFALGFLGSFARSDFGLLPFSIFVAALIFFSTIPKRNRNFGFVGFLGASFGLVLTFAHNFIFTNEILQSSAKMKTYWSQLGEPNYYPVPILIGILIGTAGLLLFALLIGAAIFPKFAKKQSSSQTRLTDEYNHSFLFMLTSAGICIVGYTLFYSRNGAIQPWYTANLILPVSMLIFAISDYVAGSLNTKARLLFTTLFLLALGLNITKLYPLSATNAHWPHQEIMFKAGNYLAENKFNCRIGAWNAGIIGYYEGGNVVNLDGLVNNEIYQYAIQNKLPTYISKKNICYIVDFENMLTNDALRLRGGYDNAEFVSSLTPELVFDEGQFGWRHLTIYHVP